MTPLTRNIAPMLIAIFATMGCSPMQSRIDPPYPFQGKEYGAEEIQQVAAEQCGYAQSPQLPPGLNPFTTDGCSAWLDRNLKECCIEHDIQYWCANTLRSRKQADQVFRDCARERSGPATAFVVYWGARVGGAAWLPFPWRWGYGYPWLAIRSLP